MDDRLKWYRRRYVLLACLLLLTIFSTYNFVTEVSGTTAETIGKNMSNTADFFGVYVDDMLGDRNSYLEKMADDIGKYIQKEDADKVKEILSGHQTFFAAFTVLKPTGEKEYDNGETVMNFNLVQSNALDTLLKEKKSITYDNLVQDSGRNKYMAICTPVEYKGKVVAILVGEVKLEDLNNLMQKWELSQEGCAFLLTDRGNYVTSGERFYDYIGGEASDLNVYLENCRIKQDSMKLGDVEKSMKKRSEAIVYYIYDGEDYILKLIPSEHCNWYMGCLVKEKAFYVEGFHISSKLVVFISITVLAWIFAIGYFILLIYRYKKDWDEVKRYRDVAGFERSLIFERRFSPSRLEFFGNVRELFGTSIGVLMGEEVYDVYDRVHPDDISVRGRLHQFYDDEQEEFAAEVRIKTNDEEEEYGWFRITGRLVRDSRLGINSKFIGKIENADQEIVDERNLVERAENDLLTGILNKKTFEEKVVGSLANKKGDYYYIFFIIDLDNFKNVNDKLGHIMGDKAIVDTAKFLSEIFRTNAHVGRLGGDEFSVCVAYNAFDEESLKTFIKSKADKVCEVNRRTYSNGETDVSISSSVGIAIAPTQADDFETLYKKADSALYKSKNGGKNCYHIFGEN